MSFSIGISWFCRRLPNSWVLPILTWWYFRLQGSIYISTSCQVISYEIRYGRPYIEAAPSSLVLGSLLILYHEEVTVAKQPPTLIRLLHYIYRCTELSKPQAALTYHPIKRILTLLFLASYTSSAQKMYVHRSELKGIHSHTKNKNNLGNAFQ